MTETEKGNIFVRVWKALWRPSLRHTLASLLVVGFAAGVVFWGGFNWAMELTNTETFCISCHEMEDFVYEEYTNTVHYANRTGVRATCPDCHVPKEWIHKVVRKVRATNELFHHLAGSVDTRDKFEAKRIELAKHVWSSMKANDSRECRNCHGYDFMDLTTQEFRTRKRHLEGQDEGKTCIDCHKGVSHELPAGAFEAERELTETTR
jgi:cytochrome c-type protein NapC